ncbi:MAG: helix-turn-helix domain-containing protein, partial [Defluviitaleaceae bacterium]|nr:helix-turn-helix domain-containing protein [Defluviitaleaceae bacterium]
NISAGYLSSVENNNKVPSIHSLVKIAEALNVSLELLVNDKEKIPFVAENSLKLDEATSMLMKMNPLELNFTLDSMRNLLKFRKG